MSKPLQVASSASAAPIAAASRHDSSWKVIAEHFAKLCLCHRGTTLPQCPAVKAPGAPQFHESRPKPPPARHPLHSPRCSRVFHKPPRRVCLHRSRAPGKPSPRLHHRDAPPPAKYQLCSVHPGPSAARQVAPACSLAPQRRHKSVSSAPNKTQSTQVLT